MRSVAVWIAYLDVREDNHENTRVHCVRGRRWDRRRRLAHDRERHPRAAAGAGAGRTADPGGAADRAAGPESAHRRAAERQEGASVTGDAGDRPKGPLGHTPTTG